MTLGFVFVTATVRRRLPRRRTAEAARPAAVVAGVILAVAGGALVGLRGPRSVPLALACSATFVGSWLLLRVP